MGTDTFSMRKLSSVTQPSKTRPTGSFKTAISLSEFAMLKTLPSSKSNLSNNAKSRPSFSPNSISFLFSLTITEEFCTSASAILFKILFFLLPSNVAIICVHFFAFSKKSFILEFPFFYFIIYYILFVYKVPPHRRFL